jgi:hypothetical protein
MAAITCHALMQNLVRHQYHAPPCPVYVCLPPLVHQFPLLSLLKAIGAGLITCILVLCSTSSPFTSTSMSRVFTTLMVVPARHICNALLPSANDAQLGAMHALDSMDPFFRSLLSCTHVTSLL